jgi:hypothetical protein
MSKKQQTEKTVDNNTNQEEKMTDKMKLEAMIAKLQAENAELKKTQARRPDDAMTIPGAHLIFQKKTHTDLVGKKVKFVIPLAKGVNGFLSVSGEVKLSANGNARMTLRGWLDPSTLDLGVQGDDEEKEGGKSFEEVAGV